MKKIFWLLVPFLSLLLITDAWCKNSSINEDSTSIGVLFIGNSYTYYHSMPQLFKAMAEFRFPNCRVNTTFVGHGGASLKQQWEEGRALEQIKSGKWDYVVLQEQSMLGTEIIENGKSFVRSPDQFFEYAHKFVNKIQQNGAKTVFYMTWSRKTRPDQQKYLTYAYMSMAKQTESLIAPVGMVWDSLRTNTSFDLYEFDGSHPSVYGAYIAAITIFAAVFDINPIGIAGHLEGHEILRGGKISGTKSLLCDLIGKNVMIIQNEVLHTFDRMKANGGYLDVEKAVSIKKPSTLSVFFEFASNIEGQMIMLAILFAGGILVKVSILLFKKRRILRL